MSSAESSERKNLECAGPRPARPGQVKKATGWTVARNRETTGRWPARWARGCPECPPRYASALNCQVEARRWREDAGQEAAAAEAVFARMKETTAWCSRRWSHKDVAQKRTS